MTAGGKNVAPAVLEDRLRAHLLVDQCLVVGDGQPFIGALITIDRDAVPDLGRGDGKPAASPTSSTTPTCAPRSRPPSTEANKRGLEGRVDPQVHDPPGRVDRGGRSAHAQPQAQAQRRDAGVQGRRGGALPPVSRRLSPRSAAGRSRSWSGRWGASRTRTATTPAASGRPASAASAARCTPTNASASSVAPSASTSARVSIWRLTAFCDRAGQHAPSASSASTSGTTAGSRIARPRRSPTAPTTSASRPTPKTAPAAPSSEPVSTSSCRACASSWATTESASVARHVVDEVVVEHDPTGAAEAGHVGVEGRRTA